MKKVLFAMFAVLIVSAFAGSTFADVKKKDAPPASGGEKKSGDMDKTKAERQDGRMERESARDRVERIPRGGDDPPPKKPPTP